jgi:hypothetical protein
MEDSASAMGTFQEKDACDALGDYDYPVVGLVHSHVGRVVEVWRRATVVDVGSVENQNEILLAKVVESGIYVRD